jgi:hypothetical protein
MNTKVALLHPFALYICDEILHKSLTTFGGFILRTFSIGGLSYFRNWSAKFIITVSFNSRSEKLSLPARGL